MRTIQSSLFAATALVALSQPVAAETTNYTFSAGDLGLSYFNGAIAPYFLTRTDMAETRDWTFGMTIDTDQLSAPLRGSQLMLADLADGAVTFTSAYAFDGSLSFDANGQIDDWDLSAVIDEPEFDSVAFAETRPGYTAVGELVRPMDDVWVRWDGDNAGSWQGFEAVSRAEVIVTPVPPAGLALAGGMLALFGMRRLQRDG